MPSYTANTGQGTEVVVTTSFTNAKLLLAAQALTATLTPCWINEWSFGASGPPNATDCSIEWQVGSLSVGAVTGGNNVTPFNDTVGQRAPGTTISVSGTGGATLTTAGTGTKYSVGLNQRATYRWTAIPGYEMVIPATNFSGLSLGAVSATYASTAGASIHFFE